MEAASPKYTGVRKRKWGKWVAEIRLPNSRERIWLGSFESAEKAARAFDAALYCLRGPGARFNFPDNPPVITGGRSLTPQQIQVVASRFACEEEEDQLVPPQPSPPRGDQKTEEEEEEEIISARGGMSGGNGGPMLGQVEQGNNNNEGTNSSNDTSSYWPFIWENENLVGPQTSGDFGFFTDDDSTNLYFPTQQPQQQLSSDFYYDDGACEDDFSHYSINLWNF
ncbi:PREDICTED: ethylene-responsive transcription factor ERF016-like [Camelina sativa]|uniref:Ethylene-responsive transcription factor ERF016-like n=1 Tax=Camelina sativa TaxID=90675 RepID=A0ABM0Y7K0_CAMSA|nr:PREDICTED: ethylene-responsive transcription factor ERF016-like [Camelina sativa]